MNNTKTAPAAFKAVGMLHAAFAGLMAFTFIMSIFALLALSGGNSMLTSVGESGVELPDTMTTLLGLGEAFIMGILYGASALGFFAYKKWQPNVYTAVVGLSLLNMVYRYITQGFTVQNAVATGFLVLWMVIWKTVQDNKALFKNN